MTLETEEHNSKEQKIVRVVGAGGHDLLIRARGLLASSPKTSVSFNLAYAFSSSYSPINSFIHSLYSSSTHYVISSLV